MFRGRLLLSGFAFFTPHVLGALLFLGIFGLDYFLIRFLPAESATADRWEYLLTQSPVLLRYLHLWLLPYDLTVEQAFNALLPPSIQRDIVAVVTRDWRERQDDLLAVWKPIASELTSAYIQIVAEDLENALRLREAGCLA